MSGPSHTTSPSRTSGPSGASPRNRWSIDELLDGMIGQSVRVAAEAFAPVGPTGPSPRLIRTNDLVLPDGTDTNGMPVFFEGILLESTRQIGVIHVKLGPPKKQTPSTEGCVHFRGVSAAILRGPALVRLAFPFHIERLPAQEENYWRDIRFPQAQFVFTSLNGDRRQ